MRKGYTLIEVLISLTIIGLLFGFGYANFRDYSRRQVLAAVAEGIKTELRFTQSKATAGEKPEACNTGTLSSYSFVITTETSYQIIANCSGGVNVSIKSQELREGISMTSNQNTISFKVLGQGNNIPQAIPVLITLIQVKTDNTATVTVTSGGEIK